MEDAKEERRENALDVKGGSHFKPRTARGGKTKKQGISMKKKMVTMNGSGTRESTIDTSHLIFRGGELWHQVPFQGHRKKKKRTS